MICSLVKDRLRIYLQAARTAQNGTDDGRKRNRRGERLEEHRTDRVPNLELDGLVVDGDHAGAKLDADGEVVHGLEALVRELQQQARLPHACKAQTTDPTRQITAARIHRHRRPARHPSSGSPGRADPTQSPPGADRAGIGGAAGGSGAGTASATDLCRR